MTPQGPLNPLRLIRRLTRRLQPLGRPRSSIICPRTLRLSATLASVTLGTLLLANCGDGAVGIGAAVEQMAAQGSSSSSSASASSSASSSSSSSSAGMGWVDLSAAFPGHIVSQVAVVPGEDKLLALTAMNPAGYHTAELYGSVDGGATWERLDHGQGAGSAPLTVSPLGVAFDPKDPKGDTFWIFGNFAGASGALFSTTDGGNTFKAHAVGSAPYEIDGISIDPGSATMLATQHQPALAVYKSTDGGETWTPTGASLPAGDDDAGHPYILDAQTYLVGLSSAKGSSGAILRSADGGNSWTEVAQNYNVFGAPTVMDGVLYWSFYNGADGGILASSDGGQSWQAMIPGGLAWSVAPIAQSAGRLASLNGSNEIMLFSPGTTGLPTELQPAFPLTVSLTQGAIIGLTYDAVRQAYIGWVEGGGIQRLDMQ